MSTKAARKRVIDMLTDRARKMREVAADERGGGREFRRRTAQDAEVLDELIEHLRQVNARKRDDER